MKGIESCRQAQEYLLALPKFTKKNSREDTRAFYVYLGKPGSRARIIHVAGTNGKGSVCAYMASCLKQGGYRTGMFTSPHLVDMRERIRIGGEWIGEEEFFQAFSSLASSLSAYEYERNKDYHPTFFEWLFFLAMIYFEEKEVRVIVLETGLGGRLDATNVIDSPAACVITGIGLDHMEYLGSTYEEIAGEKAGIIKPGSPVIYSTMRQESERIIEQKATEYGCPCRKVEKGQEGRYDLQNKRIDFSFFSRYYGYIPLIINSPALYQQENVSLALAALEEAGFILDAEAIFRGVRECRWEGRMEEVLAGVYLDGAHNRDGIEAFLESVKWDGCEGQRWLLFSVVADKEYEIMKDLVLSSRLFSRVAVAPLNHERSLSVKVLQEIFVGQEVSVFNSISDGLEEILRLRKEKDRVYAAGSLYLVGEVKGYLKKDLVEEYHD